MTPAAKSLLLKAQDHLDTAKRSVDDMSQHDIVGYNLAQAVECYLKALCVLRNLEYPKDSEGHDLDALMTLLEEDHLAAVSSHADVIELTRYNSLSARVHASDRLDLNEFCGRVEDMKVLFR
jgi:HEPN domain-containing protein